MARRFALPTIYRRGDGFAAFALSVLLHGGIVAVLVYGVYFFQGPPQEEVLPIEAELDRVTASPHVEPQPQPQPVQTPPQPSPEELAQQEAAKEQAAKEEALKQQQAEQERQRQEKEAQEKAAAAEQAAQKKAEAERVEQAAEKAAAEKVAAEKAAAEKVAAEKAAAAKAVAEKAAAEAKRKADLQKQLEEEEKATKAAEAEAKRQADLKKQLESEEQQDTAARAHADELRASWQSAISARIHRAWSPPPSTPTDLRCELHVTQEPGGNVTNVTLGSCNADTAVKESIQTAVYRASPLPAPPDPSVFDRNLTLIFKP